MWKRTAGFMLALAMVISSMPAANQTVYAARATKIDMNDYILESKDKEVFTYADAVINSSIDTFYAMTVTVSAGSIEASGYTYADMLINHQSMTWEFNGGKSRADVQTILRSIKFTYGDGMKVTVNLSANKTELPDDMYFSSAEINGTTHYYGFVRQNITWGDAYKAAKGYSYNGLKGYLATVTSKEEDELMNAISTGRGWAGGARVSQTSTSKSNLDLDTWTSYKTTEAKSSTQWKWVCGPEAGDAINISGSKDLTNGVQNGSGYSNWTSGEPNATSSTEGTEWVMEIHESGIYWNDLREDFTYPSGWTSDPGYFIEFSSYDGGYVDSYSEDNNTTVSVDVEDPEPECTAPEGITGLMYNEEAQELITAGKTSEGTMQYALGADGTYSEAIPTAVEAGTYKVYYKIVGDSTHTDKTYADPIEVTIAKATRTGEVKDSIPAGVAVSDEVTLPAIPDKMTLGAATTMDAEISDLTISGDKLTYNASADTKEGTAYTILIPVTGETGANYEDYEIVVTLTAKACEHTWDEGKVTKPATTTEEGVRVYTCTVCSEEKTEVIPKLPEEVQDTEKADQQIDTRSKAVQLDAGLKVVQKGKKVTVSWGKAADADKYVLYAAYCGNKYTKVKSTSSTKATVSKINGKAINQKKIYKFYVEALKDGKVIGRSLSVHVVGTANKKYTNAKKVTVKKTAVTVAQGKTSAIKAKLVLKNSKCKGISDGHVATFRYMYL